MLSIDLAGDIELSGSRQDLLTLAALCSSKESGRISLRFNPSHPNLTSVSIRVDDGLVTVALAEPSLEIRGECAMLSILGENIESLANEQPTKDQLKPHLHIEFFPEHFYLSETSEPLVVVLLADGDGD